MEMQAKKGESKSRWLNASYPSGRVGNEIQGEYASLGVVFTESCCLPGARWGPPPSFLQRSGSWKAVTPGEAEHAHHLGNPGPWWSSLTLIDCQTLQEGRQHLSWSVVWSSVFQTLEWISRCCKGNDDAVLQQLLCSSILAKVHYVLCGCICVCKLHIQNPYFS